MKNTHKPGDLLKMYREGGVKRKAAMKKAGIKMSGTFHGKSNTLGQGGRAAQLKARGVPGGVIGNLARAAHAAPGQANYHKRKASKKKAAMPEKQNLGLAMKKSHKMKSSHEMKSAQHIHIHLHGAHGMSDPEAQGTQLEHREEGKKEFKRSKMKRKEADPKPVGTKLEHEEEGKDEFKKSHKCKGASCKHASHKKKARHE